MAVKVIISWRTRDREAIAAMRKYFGIPKYTTVNGLTPAAIEDKDMPMFEETARRGFFRYRRIEWTFNGISYSW